MLPPYDVLRNALRQIITDKAQQGHVVDGLRERVDRLPDSYDVLAEMATVLSRLPIRPDWRFVEPNALEEIWAEADPDRATEPLVAVDVTKIAPRVETAFASAVCGCILGKPLEVRPTLEQIRAAASAVGEWPLNDYISEEMLRALGKRHVSWADCVRG